MAQSNIPVTEEAHRSNIREIQNFLRRIIYSSGGSTNIVPDGVYGESTRQAVSDFQRNNSLPVTGEVDRETWEALYNADYDIRINIGTEEGILPFPSLDAVISANDFGTVIVILQAMLNTVALPYSNVYPVEINGIYDTQTQNAVMNFQVIAGLEPDGMTDIRTWNTLVRFFNSHAVG